jgi:hypothetical protein
MREGKWSAQCKLCRKAFNHDSVLRPVVAAEYQEILDGSVCGICETPDNLLGPVYIHDHARILKPVKF